METSPYEDSKSLSEESDRSDQNDETNHDTAGSGRSYECVFCKRGFTTAQALGGHMNIHRKDRAKSSRPCSTADPMVSTQIADSSYRAIQGYTPHNSTAPHQHHHEVQYVNYQTYNNNIPPSSTWGMRFPPFDYFCSPRNSPLVDLSSEYWRGGLNLGIGTSNHREDDHNKEKTNGGRVDVELDLELRLGHDP
ncbi:hypothetical protein FNV43_RR23275 [Rhamnella rubrinervis]|uniref:C2H2-type domain-containing protein n=1 Tax=Rhamnella rubrinervis TaxID=2594499 RepID=A0A8K0GT84_9ROSA|nr:hypothetical protein FNV43_RR23275 [Rhamnella rubrinervis]